MFLLQKPEKGSGDSVTTTSRSSNPNVPKNVVTIKRRCENQTQLKPGQSQGRFPSILSILRSIFLFC